MLAVSALTPDTISTAAINLSVQRYVEAVADLLPRSAALEMSSRQASPDARLARLVDLKHHGNPLRHCTHKQASILVARIMGRTTEPVFIQSSTGHSTEVGKRSRILKNYELARLHRMTTSQLRREITAARESVRQALIENWRGTDA
jgi:hypothetical protein